MAASSSRRYPSAPRRGTPGRDPDVTVLVMSDEFNGPFVQVDGPAEVLDVPEAVDTLVDYFRSISGEHPDWDEYRAAMVEQGKSLLRVTPERWGPTRPGASRHASPTERAGAPGALVSPSRR